MNDYNEGDLLEAVKGETVIRGRLKADDLGLHLWVGDSGRTPENIESYGFTISVVEKAAAVVVLPTEPGYYRVGGNNAHVERTIQLLDDGEWWWVGNRYNPLPHRISPEEVGRNHAPLTRLEPVPETAKKVIEYLEDSSVIDVRDSRCAGVRAHFGVEL